MSTLGQKPATQHVSLQKQTITGNGGTSYTLQQSVGSALDVAVFINNTRQEPTTAYSASGTTLTMTGAVNSSDHFYIIFLGKAITTTGLPVDGVGTANINANAITAAKLHDDAVTHAKLPSGSVLQVVQTSFTGTTETSTSTNYANTSLAVTITPTSTNSKILIISTFLGQTTSDAHYDLKRGSTSLGGSSGFMRIELAGDAFPIGINLLDEPSTTSATTYTVAMKIASSGTVYMIGSPFKSTIQAMEIAG